MYRSTEVVTSLYMLALVFRHALREYNIHKKLDHIVSNHAIHLVM